MLKSTNSNILKMRRFYDDGAGDGGEGEGAGEGAGDGGAAQPAPFRLDSLPEDLRGNETLAKFQDKDGNFNVEQLSRSHLSLNKLLGNKDPDRYVEIPGAEDADGRRAVLERLGLPKTAEGGYELTPPENAAEFMAPDKPLAKSYVEKAHEIGILPGQAQELYAWFTGVMTEAQGEGAANTEATVDGWIESLEQEFGEAFDEKVAAANFGVEELGGDELREALKTAGLGANPAVIKAFAKVGEILSEDSGGDGNTPSFSHKTTPDQYRAKAMELQRQALNEKNVAERRRLNALAAEYRQKADPSTIDASV